MNVVIMKGRLTSDATIRTANSGTTIASFSLAVDRGYVDKDTGEKATDFIRMTAFGKTAEFIQRYTARGKEILIEGDMRQNDYTDTNGVEHHSYQVVVNRVHFCGSKSESGGGNAPQTNAGYQNAAPAAPAPPQAQTAPTAAPPSQGSLSIGDLGDLGEFEEILGGEPPF